MLSQFEYQQVNRAARAAGSSCCNCRTHSPPSAICWPFTERLKRPAQVPPCGVPSVMTRCTRAAALSAGNERSQARTTSPPMLWPTTTGAMPVASCTRCTAASMVAV